MASGENVVEVDGLPEGWQAVQKVWMSGPLAGKPYVRYYSANYKNVASLKAVLKLEGKITETKGKKTSAIKEEYQGIFREQYGRLNGATVQALPGWRCESKLLENCGQVSSRYYSPDGTSYVLIKDIEALFGQLIAEGGEVPDIEAARARSVDERGRFVSTSRMEAVQGDWMPEETSRKRARQSVTEFTEMLDFGIIKASASSPTQLLSRGCSEEVSDLLHRSAADIGKLLSRRGFKDLELMIVYGGAGNVVAEALSGIYFKMAEGHFGRPCFQKVVQVPDRPEDLVCRDVYLHWKGDQRVWCFGRLQGSATLLARCGDDQGDPFAISGTWSVQQIQADPVLSPVTVQPQ